MTKIVRQRRDVSARGGEGGRGEEGRVKNARAASSRKIREAVFSLGHAIKGGKFDTSENRKFCKVLNL